MVNNNKSLIARVDSGVFLLYLTLVIIGIISIFSVEYSSNDPMMYSLSKSFMKQSIFFGVSLFIGLIILFTDSKVFNSFAYLAYTIGLFLLIITIFIGKDIKGSHSWLSLGGFTFQPGEVCKIFTALALTKYLSSPEVNFQILKDRLIGIAIAMIPAFIIVLQDETGLALVYFSFFLVLYKEGLPNSIVIVGISLVVLTLGTMILPGYVITISLVVIGVIIGYFLQKEFKRNWNVRLAFIGIFILCMLYTQVAVPTIFKHVLKGYQKERIYSMLGMEIPEAFMELNEDGEYIKKTDPDYNVRQSKIAIGSGGFLGKGFLNGTSTKNDFVPEQSTDFIFCSIGEQFGFVGSFLLIAVYLALLLRILKLAERQRSKFNSLYAYCVSAIIFFHVAINLSMTIGLAPVIGITLPFISYGGSSLVSFSVLLFILLRLDADRQVLIR